MRRRAGAAGLALLSTLMAACGVPLDEDARPVAPEQVPFGLLAPSTTAPRPSTTVAASAPALVFFASGDRLVAVRREVPAPVLVESALAALLAGPTPEETAQGFRSAVGDGTVARSVTVDEQVARVDLGGAFAGVGGEEQILAVAQIVFTATGVPGISGVHFSLDGQPVEAPREDGTLTAQPLQRGDYPTLSPAVQGEAPP